MAVNKKIVVFIALAEICMMSCTALANEKIGFLNGATMNGNIRMYEFVRKYSQPLIPDQSAFSLGGAFNLLSGKFFNGFQAGATFYTAQPLGINSSNPINVDNTLPGFSVHALGQAFLQYSNDQLLLRGGDQLIDTPWLNTADSRMIPSTYRALYGNYSWHHFTFTALRAFRFKSHTADDFNQTNLYNPVNFGGTPIVLLDDFQNQGALAVAAAYKLNEFKTDVWAYRFYDFAKLYYLSSSYTMNTSWLFQPLFGAQVLDETGDGDNILSKVADGSANAQALGLLIGLQRGKAKVTFGYNAIARNTGAFRDGDIVSPYTTGYLRDPLYTTSMIAGLVEKRPGNAFKLTGSYTYKQLDLLISFAQYDTEPLFGNTNETDLDGTFHFSGVLKGLQIRNRLGIENNDPTFARFIYERLMVQYNFSLL